MLFSLSQFTLCLHGVGQVGRLHKLPEALIDSARGQKVRSHSPESFPILLPETFLKLEKLGTEPETWCIQNIVL